MNAFGVEDRETGSKKIKSLKPITGMFKDAKFGNAGGMFVSRTNKHGKVLPSAFKVGQQKGFSEGRGPVSSAMRGLEFAAAHSPGTAVAAGTAGVGGLGTAGYLAGRSKKKD
jgi:hypothetical protein